MEGLIKDIVRDLNVINIYSTGHRPKLPFTTYQVLSADTKNNHKVISYGEDVEVLERQPQAIISINCFGSTMMEAIQNSEIAHDYFIFQYDNPKYVIVEVSDIADRTVLNVDKYEHCFGFDVWVRFGKTVDRDVIFINDFKEGNFNE